MVLEPAYSGPLHGIDLCTVVSVTNMMSSCGMLGVEHSGLPCSRPVPSRRVWLQSQGRGRVWLRHQGRGRVLFRVRGEGGSTCGVRGEGGSGSESGEREGLVQGQDGLVACQLCTPDNASLVGRLESSDHQDVQCVSEFKCCYDTGEGRIVAHNLSY